jgi:hypothetical protein
VDIGEAQKVRRPVEEGDRVEEDIYICIYAQM